MKIAFLGDSITEGIPGVSFVNILQERLKDHELKNFGKGGDTVSSLKKRIKKIPNLPSYDVIILFVGVNDVFGKLTFLYKVLKTMTRQRWAKGVPDFKSDYRSILDDVLSENTRVIVIPPLLIGEDVTNKWNVELLQYVSAIEGVIKDFSGLEYIDVRKEYINYLSGKKISGFLPRRLSELLKDVREIESDEGVDERSKARGLHLTLDGVHINSKGARILADSIFGVLKKE
jgi:lysophospholipase L1-like esterase